MLAPATMNKVSARVGVDRFRVLPSP